MTPIAYQTITAAAARLGVSVSTARRWATRDLAAGVKGVERFGRAYRVRMTWNPKRRPVGNPNWRKRNE